MSILIKGMEMPKNCYVCPFCDYVSARCDAVKGNPYTPESRYEKRADFCPLVPVPPHGDLVDRREAIIDANERAYDFWLSDDEVNSTIQFLNEQAAVIPAEPSKEENK